MTVDECRVQSEVDWITIGHVIKPFGIKGELRVSPLTDVPGRFQGLPDLPSVLLTTATGRTLETSVSGVRPHNRDFVLAVRGVTTPEAAAEFRGGYLKIARGSSPALPPDHYYQHDLVGLAVYVEGSSERVGVLEEVLETGGNAVFVVREGSRETLIPATKQVVALVDIARRMMVIRRVEGLFDDTDAM